MTTDLCTDDVVVQITAPQIIPAEPASGARVAACSASVELGRRLLLAARSGDTPLVLDLMAKGAPFTTDWLGTSPLHLAAGGAHLETCAVLVRAGVSRDARTKVERTPLHLAAHGGHAAVVRLLVGAGAAVDSRDMLRMTPLHWAAQGGHTATVVELLAHGADPGAVSKFNKTPRSLALQLGRADLIKLMDDAAREREAARSVHHLVTEQNMEETPSEDPQLQMFDGIQRVQTIKTSKPKIEKDRAHKLESKSEEGDAKSPAREARRCVVQGPAPGDGPAAQLLRRHGITLLPTDDTSTVLNALQSGRTVVLSDAGRLMLRESAAPPTRPPLKVFALHDRLVAPRHPQDVQQVKLVQLAQDARLVAPGKLRRVGGPPRPALKIILNKNILNKNILGKNILNKNTTRLLASAEPADTQPSVVAPAVESECEGETEALRAALAASRRALAALQQELRVTRARLAKYEDVHAT